MTGIHFYCGLNEFAWNHHPVRPGDYACVAPIYGRTEKTRSTNGVSVPIETRVLQDSGAFVDSWGQRLTFDQALTRQEQHAKAYGYEAQIEYRVSYDLLIDEVWNEGSRAKRRWSVGEAEAAVSETVAAAKFLSQHRNSLRLCLSAQGVDASQYRRCVEHILPLMREGDILGLGGWCIIGKRPHEMMPVFHQTVETLVPLLAREGIRRVHLFGVCFAPALGFLLWHCQQQGIEVSTDSSGPSTRPTRQTDNWGYAEWIDRAYQRHPVETRGLERARHVALTIDWLAGFGQTVHCSDRYVLDYKLGRQIIAKGRPGFQQLELFVA